MSDFKTYFLFSFKAHSLVNSSKGFAVKVEQIKFNWTGLGEIKPEKAALERGVWKKKG